MVTVEFDSMGEAVRLALVAGEYVGGGLAVLLLDATDPRSEGYMAEWGVLTENVPAAAEWCRGRGNIAIDADVPAALLEALEAAGMLLMAARSAAVSVNLFFTSFAKQARRLRKGGFTGCANVFSPIPVTARRGRPSAGPSACRTCRLS